MVGRDRDRSRHGGGLVRATRLTIDTSMDQWFLENDASLIRYQDFRQRFGEDEFVVLAVEAADVFTPEILAELQHLTTMAERLPLVRRATSLANVKVLAASGRSSRTEPLMAQLPRTTDEAAQLRRSALSHPLLPGALVSDDGRAAAVLVELSRACDTFNEKAAVVRQLRAQSQNHHPGVRVGIAGTPVVGEAISRYIRKDLSLLTPICYAVLLVAAYWLFRGWAVPLISMAVVGLATLWVLGLMGLLGVKMNLLGPALTMVVVVVGVADRSTFSQPISRSLARPSRGERSWSGR